MKLEYIINIVNETIYGDIKVELMQGYANQLMGMLGGLKLIQALDKDGITKFDYIAIGLYQNIAIRTIMEQYRCKSYIRFDCVKIYTKSGHIHQSICHFVQTKKRLIMNFLYLPLKIYFIARES